ncbi:MAG TPA: condensation domain-containing protein, partial [Pyrinomonadaceae bacterium]|nr:condensation domain-containing protein [Pyrinomonadaceae bacterium]
PIANTQVYILDENFEPVPFNAAGELYVGGDGLARGYLGRPDLTAEKFLPNPFGAEPGARLYRTGDLARRRPDGNIDFLGRIDQQVKIRGHRIEPGEIESALRQHGGVRDAVVVARGDTGERRLAAYVVTEDGGAMDVAELLAHLEQKLPGYMIPSVFTQLEEMPLTPGGKVDRRAMPPPDGSRPMLEMAYAPPRTPLEEMLADWWGQALLVERIGIHDNFFALGGDSILSIQIANRAQEAGIRLTPRQIYLHRTIAELAPHLQTDAAAERGPVTGEVPLTPIQRWFFEQEVAEPHHWNLAALFESGREVKPELIEEALKHVVAHHDALRSRFVRCDSGWRQSIAPPDDRPLLTRVSLAGLAIPEQERAAEQFASRLQASLDLSGGELFRAALLEFGAGRPSRLLLVIHHLVVDIVSWGVLLNSLELAYRQLSDGEAVKLAPKTASYKEWAVRLAEYARSGGLTAESDYWTAETRLKAGRLPLDYPSGINTEGSVRALRVSLGAEETERLLRVVPKTYHTMINDVLLTALAQAFARVTQSRALLVDLENHGREELFEGLEVSRTVGWFTCIFPLLLDLGHATAPGDAIRSIKEQIRRVPNGGIGYGLLRYLSGAGEVERRLRAFPEAEISFNYVGRIRRPYAEASLWRPVDGPLGHARSPLARRRHLLEVGGGVNQRGELEMDWLYSENLHRRSTIQSFAEGFAESLRAIIAHCASKESEVYTPSDFLTGTDLSQGQLDHLMVTYAEPDTQP